MPNAAEREVMALMLRTNAELVAAVLHGADAADAVEDGSVMAAITATRSLGLVVEDILHALVQQARTEGRTWAEIGELLHVTRQAAFARFGTTETIEPLDETDIPPLAGAEDRARQILNDFLEGRFEQVRATFGDRLRERASLEVLKTHRARLKNRHGNLLEVGTPIVKVHFGLTIVTVPLAFERGDMRDRTVLDVDGQVVGFGLLPVTDPA
jgi:hypothetical protein